MGRLRGCRGLVAALGVLASAGIAHGQWYTAAQVSGPGALAFTPYAFNNTGTMAGAVGVASGTTTGFHAAISIGGSVTDLGLLPGTAFSKAVAVNDSGAAVGTSYLNANTDTHGFIFSGGVMTDLGYLTGLNYTQAYGINNAGTVVGECANQNGGISNALAFSYSNGKMTSLGLLPNGVNSSANAINDAGTAVGWGSFYVGQGGVVHAVSFANGQVNDLGSPSGYPNSEALAVNSAGTITGWAYFGSDGSIHAFAFKNETMRDLGTLPGFLSAYPNGINSAGDIVGYSDPASGTGAGERAFIYRDRVMYDLNTLVDLPGATLVQGAAINDSGQILAYADVGRTYLLTPIPGAGAFPPPATPIARLVNISTRAQVGTGGNILIPGFVVGGSGTETLLIRADGPSLAAFGVPGVLAAPTLTLTAQSTGANIATNTGWGTNTAPSQIASTAAQVGAFALPDNSPDCAVIVTLPPGGYTVQVSGVGGTTGVALAEVYEVSYTGTARLVNIATRAQVGTGANVVIPGFVINGTGTEVLMVRADGPSLTAFGVPGALARPSLMVTAQSDGHTVGSNTVWGSNANPSQISDTGASVGAFALAPGSADSALVVSLQPGAYTMQVSGVNSTTGVALAEVYEVP